MEQTEFVITITHDSHDGSNRGRAFLAKTNNLHTLVRAFEIAAAQLIAQLNQDAEINSRAYSSDEGHKQQ
jgi:hypothetical protein